MIDVNWDDNAKAAVNTYNDWALENDLGIHAFFEHLTNNGHTQPKTVADAVEYYGKTFVAGQWTHIRCGKDGKMFFASGETDSDNWQDSYLVCTREQFEAYVKEQEAKQKYPPLTQSLIDEAEQEDEKWTHKWNGRKCIVVFTDDYMSWVKGEGLNKLVTTDSLKPIKPTISKDAKRQLELYVQYRVDKYGDYAMKSDLSDYLSHHEII